MVNQKIRVAGIDPSMSNFGIAIAEIDVETNAIQLLDLKLIHTESDGSKTVIKTADNWRRAKELRAGMVEAVQGCTVAMAEIPLMVTPHPKMNPGAASLANHNSGIAIGVIAGCPIPVVGVMPKDVKLASVGSIRADKKEMIDWAMALYPSAPWRMRKLRGEMVPLADNEHLADAVGVIHAGVQTAQFKSILTFVRAAKQAST